MKGFDQKFMDELKSKNELVDLVGRYVRLEQRGGNFWGRCPFHHEKTASFSVNAAGQFYYCFGCHKSGDVISFIMEIESLDFGDAVRYLAERAGISLPEVRYDDEKLKEQKRKKERLLSLLLDAARYYAQSLRSPSAEKHVEYVKKRALTTETVAAFGLGASLDFHALPEYLKKKGYTYEEMTDAGVVDSKNGKYYDALGGRLIIPIINQFGQVVAFGGRLLEKADFAKYKNTRETSVFSKSNNLYNLNNIKKLKNEARLDGIIMVEGYMDTISLVQGGFPNVVASMGTSLTKDQARILKRYTEKVYISYDGDFAGQKASVRGLDILSDEGLEVKVVSLPDGLDPDDVIRKFGHDGYDKLLKEAMPLIDFKLDLVRKSYDLGTADGRRKYVSAAIKVIRTSPSAVEQEDLLKTLRDVSGFTIEALKRELYGGEEKIKEPADVGAKGEKEKLRDKSAMAARAVLSSYLYSKPYAAETDIDGLEFSLPAHAEIQKYISEKIKAGEKPKFNDLFEIAEEDGDELSAIAAAEADYDGMTDGAAYFSDCVKILRSEAITKKLDRLTAMFSSETDTGKRRELAGEMSKLLAEKNKLV